MTNSFKYFAGIVLETADSVKLPDYGIEYAKTDRDHCVGCEQQINKTEIRIMKVVHSCENAVISKATWYHTLCFARLRHELNWLQSAESLPGFSRLFEEDKEIINGHIPYVNLQIDTMIHTSSNEKQVFPLPSG